MIRTIKAFLGEEFETVRYHEGVDKCFSAAKTVARNAAMFGSVVDFLFVFATVALFWVGGRQVMAGHLSGGDLVAFIFYSQIIAACIGDLSQVYVELSAASGSSERVFEILDTPREYARGASVPDLKGFLEVKNLSFAYDTRPVLRNISITVPPGRFVALVGPSGAGKTTFFNLLARMYLPTAGSICLDGMDIRDLNLYEYRRQIAIVSQEPELFDGSIADNVRYGRRDATDIDVERAARDANAHDFIIDLPDGYNTQIGEHGLCLSAGQRQRIALARAFLKNSRLLLLDEPTSSVDAASEATIYQAMLRLARGRTTFVIAHHFSTVLRADRIFVMNGGKIVESGTHEELLRKRGLYTKLAALQFRDAVLMESNALESVAAQCAS